MKINRIYEFYQAVETNFRCPICHSQMAAQKPASLVCEKGHCYNLSKDGYINFLPNQKATMYRKSLFDSRRVVFDHNYYLPLAQEVASLVEGTRKKEPLCLADAGCGEGYYDCFLQNNLVDKEIFAFDSVKEAVKMGAKSDKEVRWLVGNLGEIPLRTGLADVILDIFAPANYEEFRRVLKPEGYVLKVIPGEQYLKELRACINGGKGSEAYSSQPVKQYFGRNMKLERKQHLLYQRKVDKDMAQHFLEMTPMMFGKSAKSVDAARLDVLTFEFILLLGKKENRW